MSAVVAHYDPQGDLAADLLATVRTLHARGAQVCFVSTGLHDAAAAALAPWADVVRRENTGYDFWSYKVGIDRLRAQRHGLPFERLLLLNSSVWIDDVDRLLQRMDAHRGQLDVISITLSHEVRPHLQSFWLAFESPAVLTSAAFERWWAALEPLSVREEVIARHELGLSAHFAQAGFRLGALFQLTREQRLLAVLRALENGFLPLPANDPVTIDPAWADRLNPTMYAWDALYAQLGVLKWELLRRNPHRLNLEALRADPLSPLGRGPG